MDKNKFLKDFLFLIVLFLIGLLLIEFEGYQRFYTGEHNIDQGYNMKGNDNFKDIMTDGRLVNGTYLYIMGVNQERDGLKLLLISQLYILILGLFIGILIGKRLKNETKNK